jgi:hypothetical protein
VGFCRLAFEIWPPAASGRVSTTRDDGNGAWWEAMTVEKAGDVFKLRWREKYAPDVGLITRPRFDLVLICPDAG